MKKIKIITSILITFYFSASLFLYVFQSEILYFPTAEAAHTFQVEKISIDKEIINVIVVNPDKPNAVIYFGGNSESVAKTASAYKNILPQHTMYFVSYRGYGGSTGLPREKDLYLDAQYIYDKIISRHTKVSVMGRSLGTGIATLLASTRTIHKMVLITPYDSIQNIAKDQYPLFPIDLLLNEKYDSASRVKNIKAETLIILAEFDTLIPLKRSSRLVKKFPPSQVTVEVIKEANHRNLSHQDRYYSLISSFL